MLLNNLGMFSVTIFKNPICSATFELNVIVFSHLIHGASPFCSSYLARHAAHDHFGRIQNRDTRTRLRSCRTDQYTTCALQLENSGSFSFLVSQFRF